MKKKNKIEFPRGVQVIECKCIEFAGKDVIVIKDSEDFVFLLAGGLAVFKIKKAYYIINSDVAYVYSEE